MTKHADDSAKWFHWQ